MEPSRVRVYGVVIAALVALAAALAVQVIVVLVSVPGTPFDFSWQWELYCAFVAGLAAWVMSTDVGGDLADATLAALIMAFVTYVVGIGLYPIAVSTFGGRDAFGYMWPLGLLITLPLILILAVPAAVWVMLLRLCLARYQRCR